MSIYNPAKFLLTLGVAGIVYTLFDLLIQGLNTLAAAGDDKTFVMYLWKPGVPVAIVLTAVFWLFIQAQRVRRAGGI